MVSLEELNILENKKLGDLLASCCGSSKWANLVQGGRPFGEWRSFLDHSLHIWFDRCGEKDYLEAISHHPMIGDLDTLRKQYRRSGLWSEQEQAGVNDVSEEVLVELVKFNRAYIAKFGFIFLICATGKSADEMLKLGKARLQNTREEEVMVAAREQYKITLLRFEKLFSIKNHVMAKSQITTHVLDTSRGIPGTGILVRLQQKEGDDWKNIASGVTDEDGRVSNLLPPGQKLVEGTCQLIFETGKYFEEGNTFFPEVSIQFNLGKEDHYHVPLLLSPYSYSTYRGS